MDGLGAGGKEVVGYEPDMSFLLTEQKLTSLVSVQTLLLQIE